MRDEDFALRLSKAPKPKDVVEELFQEARSKSEQRFFCAIMDLETITHEGTRSLVCELTRFWVVQQFADYFSRVSVSTSDFPESKDADFVRRLHMTAYSQFWECLGVQRLLQHLIGIASGQRYDPRLFLDERPKTYTLFRSMREQLDNLELGLSEFLTAVYSNQIRNAFAHSQFWIVLNYLTFENHEADKDYSISSLRLETWDMLFDVTSEFIAYFFNARREAERDLLEISPYRVDLPEFMGPFDFSKDDRGYWTARPIRR